MHYDLVCSCTLLSLLDVNSTALSTLFIYTNIETIEKTEQRCEERRNSSDCSDCSIVSMFVWSKNLRSQAGRRPAPASLAVVKSRWPASKSSLILAYAAAMAAATESFERPTLDDHRCKTRRRAKVCTGINPRKENIPPACL